MENRFTFVKALIRVAGDFIRDNMVQDLQAKEKTRFGDLATNLDKATQELLITKIKQAYPNDNIMAEENNIYHPTLDGNVWVLDPIDGTVNFAVQGANFAVMTAYYENGKEQFGLVYDVANNISYSGDGQFDVYANDKQLAPYRDVALKRISIGCNASMFSCNYCGICDLIDQTLGVRVYGGAGLSTAYAMTGQLLVYFSYIQPWDYAAVKIMGEKLGYVLLTFDGKEPDFATRQKVVFVPKQKLPAIQTYLD